MHSVEKDYLRSKLEGLKAQRADVKEGPAGKKFLTLGNGKIVPATFLERWIKEAEIDLGLRQGRAMEDQENAD